MNDEDTQPDTRNHKGEYCPYVLNTGDKKAIRGQQALLCQEGYCNECEVFIEWRKQLWQ